MARKSLAAPIGGGTMPSKSEDDYRAEDDHRTLMRAEEVRQDPTRMKGVARHHAKTVEALKGISRVVKPKMPRRSR